MIKATVAATIACFGFSGAAMAQESTCTSLTKEWKQIETNLADNQVAGLLDNSAPRATMRAAEDTALYSKASITLRLMEVNKCALPKASPSSLTYLSKSLSCKTATMGATAAQIKEGIPACDKTKW